MIINKRISLVLIVFFSIVYFSSYAHADDAKVNPVSFSALIDTSYNYLQQSNLFTSNVYDRVYDLNQNGVTLQQAAGTMSYLPTSGFGMLLNAMVGRDSITTNAYGLGVWTDSPDFGVDVTQGFLQYIYNSNFSVDVGKFTTLNGAETVAPTTNTNFSRSILFGYGGPYTALGVRSTYTMNDKVKFNVGMNDGWDTIRDFSRGPTLEFNNTLNFNPKLSLATTIYCGKQRIVDRTATGPEGTRTLLDFVGTLNITEKFIVLVNYDYAWQTQAQLADGNVGRALWNGVAGYLNYQWTDAWRSSVRGEFFSDAQGFRTGVAQNWEEITLTLAYTVPTNKNLEIRGELRRDFSDTNAFLRKNSTNPPTNYQQSVAVEAVYKMG